jgi:hypothetical protein
MKWTAKQPRNRAVGRMKAGQMNKTESAYAEHLKAAQIAGEIELWWFECVGLKVADKCHYYPDFMVLYPDGRVEIHEVKARASNGSYRCEDDAKVKLRVCADKFPFPLVVVWPKQGGARFGWDRLEI